MKDDIVMPPVLFLDDWPQPPKCGTKDDPKADFEGPGLTELKKWRFQTLLAVNPWGIPLLAFGAAYKRMFGKDLDVKELGFEHLSELVANLPDVFSVQEPDESTALMFPDYSQDRVLHDSRIGHVFDQMNNNSALLNNSTTSSSSTVSDVSKNDPEVLVSYAWLNRDDDLPTDVVLAGEHYGELILPMTSANIPGTRGVHQAVLVGAAAPNYFYLNIKSDNLELIARLTQDVSLYFKECGQPIEMYSVPEEFLYPGFPCLVYIETDQVWERCAVVSRKARSGKVLIETIDFGGTRLVNQIYLYLMPRKFFDIPRQGVLVSLMGIKPRDGTEKWSTRAGIRLRCFSNSSYYLSCLLVEPKEDQHQQQKQQLLEQQNKRQPPVAYGGESVGQVDRMEIPSAECGLTMVGKKDNSLSSSTASAITTTNKAIIKGRSRKRPFFEVLVCDRNDDELDLYLDEILIMESYAISDEKRSADVKILRQQLNEALKTISRPVNPLN